MIYILDASAFINVNMIDFFLYLAFLSSDDNGTVTDSCRLVNKVIEQWQQRPANSVFSCLGRKSIPVYFSALHEPVPDECLRHGP